jgi:hypothetical protein
MWIIKFADRRRRRADGIFFRSKITFYRLIVLIVQNFYKNICIFRAGAKKSMQQEVLIRPQRHCGKNEGKAAVAHISKKRPPLL